MIEGLRERFLPRFIDSARRKIDRASALEALGAEGALNDAASEMHGLAGEASMLELSEIGLLARSCEAAARQGDRDALRRGLAGLRAASEALAAHG